MEPTTIAIDLAKRVFQIHYVEPETGALHRNAPSSYLSSPTGLRAVSSWRPAAARITGPVSWRGLATTCGSSQPSSYGHS